MSLTFPHAAPPPPGETIEVAPGVRWLRMPLPFALDHINLWLLEDGPGWTAVDTGLASKETRGLWERIFATALDGRPITRVLVTHFHPDHMGLAGWLCERWSAPLWTTEREWLWARMLSFDRGDDGFKAAQGEFYRLAGLAPDQLDMFAKRGNPYPDRAGRPPGRFRRIADGDEVAIGGRAWRVVIGRGHAPEHACLYCPELDVLISGDQVLPKISPNVSLWPTEPEADPLSQFLTSLERVKAHVPASALVLPSHNLPFFGLHERIDELAEHHRLRLAEVEAACDEGARTAAEIVPILFRRKLDHHTLGFAVGEALSHLRLLVEAGRLDCRIEDGAWRFARNAA